jgi:hypothetical protein
MKGAIALALTWDGARWPTAKLSRQAQAFLGKGHLSPIRSRREITKFLGKNQVVEIRICWVPSLRGGDQVLSDPFVISSGKRLGFRVAKMRSFENVLGVIYRRA